ncbi:MAG: gamma-glutamyl-gamma-aminobutyrate hydrolase family protein [Acidobacteriaceae bacterium]
MICRVALPEPHSGKPDYNERSTHFYCDALKAVGLDPVVIPSHSVSSAIAQTIAGCQGILLPGSPADVSPQKYGDTRQSETAPADPLRDNLDEMLLQDAHNLYKPIFAICYGIQGLNVWRTGTLIQHLPTEPINHEDKSKERAHEIGIVAGSRLSTLAGGHTEWVNSSHHQAIRRVGDGLRVVVTAKLDGVVEAVEGTSSSHWVLGVQWHPERTFESERLSQALFEDFAGAVTAWSPRAITESIADHST